jgi:hypothetical protein
MRNNTEVSSCKVQALQSLSGHLFWDVERSAVDMDTHEKFIVQRVLEYGLLEDWVIIKKYYGIAELARIGSSLRSLEDRAWSFLATYSGVAKEKFRCYTTRQSIPQHWNS